MDMDLSTDPDDQAIGKLVCDQFELPCIIAAIHTDRVELDLLGPLPTHSALALELAQGGRFPLEPLELSGARLIGRTIEPAHMWRLIERGTGSGPRRQVRFRVGFDALLHVAGEQSPAAVCDISREGVGIDCDRWLMMDDPLVLEIPGLVRRRAGVRWRNHPRYGIALAEPFGIAELARLCYGG